MRKKHTPRPVAKRAHDAPARISARMRLPACTAATESLARRRLVFAGRDSLFEV